MRDKNSYPVWTACITPMNENKTVDFESFEKLLKRQAAAGNALLVLASTGEALSFNDEEKKQVLDFALNLNLNVPVMAGVGGIHLETQVQWVEYLNTLELNAYLLVVPLYTKPGVNGQYEWFKTLLDTANKPCMLYNVPGRTAAKLEPETIKMLNYHKNFWAVKESSGSNENFAEYVKAAPEKHLLSGDDPMLPSFAKLGAKGVVSVAANVWPDATNLYARQCLEGTFKDNEVWDKATKSLFIASNPIPAKALMSELGLVKTPSLRPPLSEKDLGDISLLLESNESIENWLQQQKA
jgi:4-hydroxy-tetrahydrodipicolinate synthase